MAGPPAPWLEAQAGDQEGLGWVQTVGKSGRGCLGRARLSRLPGGRQARPDLSRDKSGRARSIFGKEVFVEALEFERLLDPHPDAVINEKFGKPPSVDKYDALRNFCREINGVL